MRGQPAWRLNAQQTAMSLPYRGLILFSLRNLALDRGKVEGVENAFDDDINDQGDPIGRVLVPSEVAQDDRPIAMENQAFAEQRVGQDGGFGIVGIAIRGDHDDLFEGVDQRLEDRLVKSVEGGGRGIDFTHDKTARPMFRPEPQQGGQDRANERARRARQRVTIARRRIEIGTQGVFGAADQLLSAGDGVVDGLVVQPLLAAKIIRDGGK